MGTTWRIFHSGVLAQAQADQVAAFVEADEQRWSRFRETSELSKLNRCAGIPVEASVETIELLLEADRWQVETGGLFAPLVGDAMRAWGYEVSKFERAPGTAVSPGPLEIRHDELVFDSSRRIVLIPAGTRLDLGGIAKTWAARRAAEYVKTLTDDPVLLVDAGGDMVAARGDHEIEVEDPGGPDQPPMAIVRVREGQGIATSGWSRRHWTNADGQEARHVLDPRTGTPAEPAQATVISDQPVRAEVMAKALILEPALVDTIGEPAVRSGPDGVRMNERWKEVVV